MDTQFINTLWDKSIIPTLIDYIRIPNQSPLFDAEWQEHGFMDQACDLIVKWCKGQEFSQMNLEVVRLNGRTPLIFIEIPGSSEQTILLYGHFDKQPAMTGWKEGLGPWEPRLEQDKLYGRGGADDGYAVFAALTAIKSLQRNGIAHARCVIIIESCEESGSIDLPYYIENLSTRIGSPDLVICLDSGCGNYDQLWVTTSLRGLIGGNLKIDVLKEGIHSGLGSGVVPSAFLVLRQLLNRIEDTESGIILPKEFHIDIPKYRYQQMQKSSDVLKNILTKTYSFAGSTKPINQNPLEIILNRTFRPALSVIGCDGLPATKNAGNVTLPSLTVKLSMRLPPGIEASNAVLHLKQILEKDPPYEATVKFTPLESASGWNAPPETPWLNQAISLASKEYFGADALFWGEGGSIPFMGMLGKRFPNAQFLVTGVLGPGSNAHGPNEFLHIPTAKKLTNCVAMIIGEHYRAHSK